MAEDSEHDILATRGAWKKHSIANPFYVVQDGEECLDSLDQRSKYSEPGSAHGPRISLLDINMRKVDGLAILKHVRQNEKLHRLPVVIPSD